ncbi:hypothetical protein GCM10010305_11750 [Streptomyces termitum]|uniref:Uncharacterized protein n=1 Tax=Streptomyces termitum TaxID=67368 RepID=A0A918SVH8_9ACTN|nr:hypothetical protein GCM10010305_11750 [Streptomyces termitum]
MGVGGRHVRVGEDGVGGEPGPQGLVERPEIIHAPSLAAGAIGVNPPRPVAGAVFVPAGPGPQ